MFWPFNKKKIIAKKETKQRKEFYSFEPTEDITAYECAQFLAEFTWRVLKDGDYISSLPISARRHFKKIPLLDEAQTLTNIDA
ncbi:hypothetical protein [Nitrosomonas sp.]|uniref:hypothetical protein n=1 Tax=Nitrosomonas sp. TaxID=42353 RepID=UPI0025D908F9|nr:hypothetical protein [Nitrosomonas sp.]